MRILVLLALTIFLPACTTRPPTNTELAAAMAAADSVLILRLNELRNEESPTWNSIAIFSGAVFDESMHSTSSPGIEETIYQSLPACQPTIFACARLHPFRVTQLWWTTHSLDDLAHKLGGPDSGVTEHAHFDGISLYSGASNSHPWCVAILDRHMLLVANTRSDIEPLIKTIRANNRHIPEQWRDASTNIAIDSPLLILRSIQPIPPALPDSPDSITRSQIFPPEIRDQLRSFSVTTSDLAAKTFHVRGITRDPPRITSTTSTQKFLGLFVMGSFDWRIQPFNATTNEPNGFRATLDATSTESTFPIIYGLSGLLW